MLINFRLIFTLSKTLSKSSNRIEFFIIDIFFVNNFLESTLKLSADLNIFYRVVLIVEYEKMRSQSYDCIDVLK